MEIALYELERAIKYRKRELDGFQHKLILLDQQKEQYENELIPKFQKEIAELESTMYILKSQIIDEIDLPF